MIPARRADAAAEEVRRLQPEQDLEDGTGLHRERLGAEAPHVAAEELEREREPSRRVHAAEKPVVHPGIAGRYVLRRGHVGDDAEASGFEREDPAERKADAELEPPRDAGVLGEPDAEAGRDREHVLEPRLDVADRRAFGERDTGLEPRVERDEHRAVVGRIPEALPIAEREADVQPGAVRLALGTVAREEHSGLALERDLDQRARRRVARHRQEGAAIDAEPPPLAPRGLREENQPRPGRHHDRLEVGHLDVVVMVAVRVDALVASGFVCEARPELEKRQDLDVGVETDAEHRAVERNARVVPAPAQIHPEPERREDRRPLDAGWGRLRGERVIAGGARTVRARARGHRRACGEHERDEARHQSIWRPAIARSMRGSASVKISSRPPASTT